MASVDALAGCFPSRDGSDESQDGVDGMLDLSSVVTLDIPSCVLTTSANNLSGSDGAFKLNLLACASADGEGDRPGCRQGNTGLFYWRGASEGLLRVLFSTHENDLGNGDDDDNDGAFVHPSVALAKATRVLELGAGLGGAGIGVAVGMAGRQSPDAQIKGVVVITDGNPDAVEASRRNVDLVMNDETNMATKALRTRCVDVSCEVLLWGQANHDAFFEKHPDSFDVVVGCDLIYSHEQLPMLFATIWQLLKTRRERSTNSNPMAVIAFRDRSRLSPVHPNLDAVLTAAFMARKGGLLAEVLGGDYGGSEAEYEGAAGRVQIILITLQQ